jgi:hypothetical protein
MKSDTWFPVFLVGFGSSDDLVVALPILNEQKFGSCIGGPQMKRGSPAAAQETLDGTYQLISRTKEIADTGQIEDTFGKQPVGFITYGRDGRMMVIIVRDRAKPTNVNLTDEQRADLHRSMTAYAGTYTFDGKTVTHNIDISWNEIWTGTSVMRDVQKDGDRLTYTTRAAPSPVDGKMSIVTLVWEKVK